MKKQTKWVAILSASALLALGANFSSFAAINGWALEGNEWYYYENDYALENEWKKSADGNYYYLGENGAMLRSTMVDDTYYVDSNGMRVHNQWRYLPAISADSGSRWFYFGDDGKAITSSSKTINNQRYVFNENGEMRSGLIETGGKTYYHGSSQDGARKTNAWYKLTPKEDNDDDEAFWYYFDTNGVRLENKKQKINQKTYLFNSNGRMLSGWVNTETFDNITESISSLGVDAPISFAGLADDGALKMSEWILTYAPEDEDQNNGRSWYYFQSSAKPHVGDLTPSGSIKKIGTKYYGFNPNGIMYSDLRTFIDGEGNKFRYYFGAFSDGSLKTGKQTVTDDQGDSYSAFFNTSSANRGVGVTSIEEGTLYLEGIRLDAESGRTYSIANTKNGLYVVNEKGKAQTNKTNGVKDANENKLYTNSNGFLTKAELTQAKKIFVLDTTAENDASEVVQANGTTVITYNTTASFVAALEAAQFSVVSTTDFVDPYRIKMPAASN
ncbi:hypothetical protein FACS189418_8310 [Clostridia bacterium]|nr:hypothetical protein FACS189418_8310 [Clostridia bacterium]